MAHLILSAPQCIQFWVDSFHIWHKWSLAWEYVVHNDQRPGPIPYRSFSKDFVINLLKYDTFCHVRSTACTVLDEYLPNLAQMITRMRGCVMCKDLWSWLISSTLFSYDIAIKLLNYGTSCSVRSTAHKVLYEFFPYLAPMVTSMRGCVACSYLWPWHISSRLFSCDIAHFIYYIYMWHKCNPWGEDVSHDFSSQ